MEGINSRLDGIIQMIIEYAPKLMLAIAVLIIGLWIIGKLMVIVDKGLESLGLGDDIRPYLKSIIGVLFKIMLIFSVAGIVGIETTSFVAVLAAAGFAIGMALQGSLGNFAAGVMVLVFKPYKVGDLVEVQDEVGHVKEIQIFNTVMTTLDNVNVIIPNGMAINDKIRNLSAEKFLRVDMTVTMPYDEDFKKVENVILDALKTTPKVLEHPAPMVGILEFDSHNIKVAVRPYSSTEDYWDVYFESLRNVKSALGKADVKVAYSEGVEMGNIG